MSEEIRVRIALLSGKLSAGFHKITGVAGCKRTGQASQGRSQRKGGLAVPEVMREVVSLRLEGVEACVFALLARARSRRVRRHSLC